MASFFLLYKKIALLLNLLRVVYSTGCHKGPKEGTSRVEDSTFECQIKEMMGHQSVNFRLTHSAAKLQVPFNLFFNLSIILFQYSKFLISVPMTLCAFHPSSATTTLPVSKTFCVSKCGPSRSVCKSRERNAHLAPVNGAICGLKESSTSASTLIKIHLKRYIIEI